MCIMCLLSEIMSVANLGTANKLGNCNVKLKIKVNKILLAINMELSYDIYWVSDVPHRKFMVGLRKSISEIFQK